MLPNSRTIIFVLSLCLGQGGAFASESGPYQDHAGKPTTVAAVVDGTLAAESPTAGQDNVTDARVVQKEFFPGLPRDIKRYLADLMAKRSSPLLLAKVCRSWCWFMLGYDHEGARSANILAMIKSAVQSDTNFCLLRRLELRDTAIIRNGILRYQQKDVVEVDTRLSAMYMDNANGELALPGDVAPYLCVTRMTDTFVRPRGDNTRKTLVLLLMLTELKKVAQEISTDATFRQNVTQADLSQNAICVLIRDGGDDLAKWGLSYTILKYSEMNSLSIWQLYTHKKSSWFGPVWSAHMNSGRSFVGLLSFLNIN